jgi:hypothetical protein
VNRDFGSLDAVVIHVGTNDMKRTGNLGYVMGDAYDLINTAKNKCQDRVSTQLQLNI